MMKVIALLTKEKEKTAMNDSEHDGSDIFRASYNAYKKYGNSVTIFTR